MSIKHILLPDSQVRPGVPTNHLEAAGNYIAEKKPDVIVHIGDHWDCPSLSGWDSVQRKVKEKVKYSSLDGKGDVEAGNEAFFRLNKPIKKVKNYSPRRIFTLGNHEQRIERWREEFPHIGDAVSYDHLNFEGWQVVPYLKPICIHGIHYAHFFHPHLSPRAIGGAVPAMLNKIGYSFSQGHRPGLEVGRKALTNGKVIRGVVAGSFYQHFEQYKGHQGNAAQWNGIIVKHEVRAGDYSLCEVGIDYLLKNYS